MHGKERVAVASAGDDGNGAETQCGGAASANGGLSSGCSVKTEDLPTSTPATLSGLGLRSESVSEEPARTEPAAQHLGAIAITAMVQVGAAHEHAASQPAPNEDPAAQAPEPASAGDAAFGRRSSQRRQMPPPVDLAALLEETESSGQDAGATQVLSARHSASFSNGSRSCSSSDRSSPPPTLSRHSSNSSPTSAGSQRRRRSTQSDQQSRDEQVQSAVHPGQGYQSKTLFVFVCISFFVFFCTLCLGAARGPAPGPKV
jgi:hypothetical protein